MKSNHIGKIKERKYNVRKYDLGYYLILTDTAETEKNYFNGIKNKITDSFKDRIRIEVITCSTSNLVKEALRYRNEDPQLRNIWIVFDRDRVNGEKADFNKIIKEAKNNDVNVGWSNPCIEIWFLAYFNINKQFDDSGNSQSPVCGSKQCVDTFKKTYKKYLNKTYSKNDTNIYDFLFTYGKEDTAISLMERVINDYQKQEIIECSKMISSSTLYLLVKEFTDYII